MLVTILLRDSRFRSKGDTIGRQLPTESSGKRGVPGAMAGLFRVKVLQLMLEEKLLTKLIVKFTKQACNILNLCFCSKTVQQRSSTVQF